MQAKLFAILTLLLAAAAGWLDVHAREVQGPVLVLLFSASLMGALDPRGALRWALMLGLSVPIAHLVSRATGHVLPYDVANFGWTFLALVPAFVGALLGIGVRRAAG